MWQPTVAGAQDHMEDMDLEKCGLQVMKGFKGQNQRIESDLEINQQSM